MIELLELPASSLLFIYFHIVFIFVPLLIICVDCIVPQFNEPMEYAELARLMPDPATLASSNSLFTILVCGPTHAGKSTFCRYPFFT